MVEKEGSAHRIGSASCATGQARAESFRLDSFDAPCRERDGTSVPKPSCTAEKKCSRSPLSGCGRPSGRPTKETASALPHAIGKAIRLNEPLRRRMRGIADPPACLRATPPDRRSASCRAREGGLPDRNAEGDEAREHGIRRISRRRITPAR